MKTCILFGALAIGILLTASTAHGKKCCCCEGLKEGVDSGSADSATNDEMHNDHRSEYEEGGDSVSDSEGPQTPEMKLVFNLTNAYRRMVAKGEVENQPKSDKIHDLKWNNELARMAQKHASLCGYGHNTYGERQTKKFEWVGQNYAAYSSLEEDMEKWFNEHKYYHYDSNTCDTDEACGHYTQLVWADTTDVGCGWEECKDDDDTLYYLVCHYGPSGNEENHRPY
nr:venom allergen (val) protein [Hymenolepis microstoma]